MRKREYKRFHRLYLPLMNSVKANNFAVPILLAFSLFTFYDLTLEPKAGVAQENPVSSVSLDKNIIYVNPKSGDDSQAGEKKYPFKTITQALKKATSGAKIQLASGTYDETTGEIFPLVINNKIVLQGNPNNQGHKIIIKGGGSFVSPTGAGQNVAIAVLKDAERVTGITVTNDHSRGHGLWIESSSPEIVSNTFTRNGNTGVSVNGKSSPLIEDNYFYNNSGNGLLVYGVSQPNVVKNTFEQTGFGISLVQNAVSTLTDNYFDGNRIGIILEGNSQATLRSNEVINSSESGLTAIAKSRVNLGTDDEPGNNVFRSNKKLDIQNATSNEIVAVGTKTNGNNDGEINFERGEFIATVDTSKTTPLILPPLDSNVSSSNQQRLPSNDSQNASLPSPPPIVEQKASNKELVFTPSSSTVSQTPEPEPVPFLPQVNNSALGSNRSQVSSLSDVLGSRSAVPVRYKVLVEADDRNTEQKVRSLYPEAFATVYQGKSILQIGAFNNWDKARQAKTSLENLGLNIFILE